MLIAFGSLVAVQTKATQLTNTAATQLLDYAATHPDAIFLFCSITMILSVHGDASYLSEAKAHSHAGGLFFLSEPPKSLALGATAPSLNGTTMGTSTSFASSLPLPRKPNTLSSSSVLRML
jgi:hypothetical protein